MGLNLKSLIAKLNDPTRSALEGAAGLCLSRTHYDIEIEHFLTKLLDSSAGDFAAILKHFEIDKSSLTAELARSMDKLKSGNARHAGDQPHGAEDADHSVDHWLDRFQCWTGAHGLYHSRAGLR